jgi:DNA-binding MarR family transcriptional regulator
MRDNPQTPCHQLQSELVTALDAALSNFVQQAVHGRAQLAAATSLLAGMPLSTAALTLLDRLGQRPMRPTELAAEVGIKPSSITKQIQELEAKGLIDRTPDELDGRAAIIRLTQFGHDLLAAVAEAKQSILCQVIEGWPAERVQEVIELLAQLTEGVQIGWQGFRMSWAANRHMPAGRVSPPGEGTNLVTREQL